MDDMKMNVEATENENEVREQAKEKGPGQAA